MSSPSPDQTAVLAADRVPWCYKGAAAAVIDVDPKSPWARSATIQEVNARRIITGGQNRFLQAQQVETPMGSGHYGYRSISSSTVLVGPDNPHVARISEHQARAARLKRLQDAWNRVWLARNSDAQMPDAARALIATLNAHLEGIDA